MKINLTDDFNNILEKISLPSFFKGEGLGNEISNKL